MISETELAKYDAYVAQYYPAYARYKHPEDYICKATIAASAAANTATNASITINGTSTNQTNIPQSQLWVMVDAYTTVSTDTALDASITVFKNGSKKLTISPPLSSNLVTNQTRPGLRAASLFEPNSVITLPTTIYAAASTSTVTNTFFIGVLIYDSTYS